MLEKFKEEIDRGNQFGALLTDLSKAFDYIDHKLLIAKLYDNGSSVKWTVLAHFLTPNFTPKNLTHDNKIFFFSFVFSILTPNTHA